MNKIKILGAACVIAGGSAVMINKALEEETTNCSFEVAELTRATDTAAVVVVMPDKQTLDLLNNLVKTTNVFTGPYLTVAALGKDGFVYVKVFLETNKDYSGEVAEEVKNIKSSLHKDAMKCSLGDKKYEIYRAKTVLEGTKQKMSFPI
jgi:hypothetical protein